MTCFVLIDETGGATTSSGEGLTPTKLAIAARILTVHINRDFANCWGVPGGALVRAGAGPDDLKPGEWPFYVKTTLPEAPDAIAYHTVNGLAVPALYDAITLSDTLFGAGGWLSALAHETDETLGDPACNRTASDGAGKLYDVEVCDPVEVQSYAITLDAGTSQEATGYVSNFVLPTYFAAGAQGPYDFMSMKTLPGAVAPPGPFQVAPSGGGNYQVWEPESGHSQQVFGAQALGRRHVDGLLAYRTAKKASPASRAYRRGLRLAKAA